MFFKRNYPTDSIKSNYVLYNLNSKYINDFRRTGGSIMKAGVFTISSLYKGFMKYERLVYNEDYVCPRVIMK